MLVCKLSVKMGQRHVGGWWGVETTMKVRMETVLVVKVVEVERMNMALRCQLADGAMVGEMAECGRQRRDR